MPQNHILMGLFADHEAAERARNTLILGGFANGRIRVHANDNAEEFAPPLTEAGHDISEVTPLSTFRTTTHARAAGMVDQVETFLERLFEPNENRADIVHFADAVRSGNALLALDDVKDDEMDNARELLRKSGVMAVAERHHLDSDTTLDSPTSLVPLPDDNVNTTQTLAKHFESPSVVMLERRTVVHETVRTAPSATSFG